MFRIRTFHRWTTVFCVVVSLLFAQLALANYVCPIKADVTPMADMAASGIACDEVVTAQPALCHQDAADAAQSFEVTKVIAPSLPAVIFVLVFPTVREPTGGNLITWSASAEARPPPDRLFLSTLRLRV